MRRLFLLGVCLVTMTSTTTTTTTHTDDLVDLREALHTIGDVITWMSDDVEMGRMSEEEYEHYQYALDESYELIRNYINTKH